MGLKPALKGQYHAGLAMLRQCIDRCPDDLWPAGEHPREFWRIAYHVLYFTHLYLMTGEHAFVAWEKHEDQAHNVYGSEEDGIPSREATYTRAEVLDYLDMIDRNVDGWVDAIDLTSQSSGFSWYKIPKLDHQLLSVRHLGVHTGQLQELLYARGVDLDWVSKR
jgi:hypothetical protein